MWTIIFTKQAVQDAKKIKDHNWKPKVQKLLRIIETNPFQNPPHFEKLIGDLNGAYSRRIIIQHRLVYQVFEDEQVVRVLRMWTHYH